MDGDIIIPKKPMSGFLLGVVTTVIVFFLFGMVMAATVFNAGGGTITNLATPSATTDMATKSYADALNHTYNKASCDASGGCTATCAAGTRVIKAFSNGDSCTTPNLRIDCWGDTSCGQSDCGLGTEYVWMLCGK